MDNVTLQSKTATVSNETEKFHLPKRRWSVDML
jgi:hypothetical protein